VKDLEKCVSFYRDKLGLELKNKEDDFAYLVFGTTGGPGLGLFSMESAAKLISESQVRPNEETIHRTYFAVFVEDVDKEYKELEEGVHFVKPPRPILGDRESHTAKIRRGTSGRYPIFSRSRLTSSP
jgi:catechol 2,3-dioxygenase-like lactoylglutathione lyase family enzyme